MDWIEDAIREGEKRVDELEVFFVTGTAVSADLKKKNVSLATSSEEYGLGIRTIQDGRIGSSGTNDPSTWRQCLEAAIASGHLATPQEWHGLPAPAQIPVSDLSFDDRLRPDAAAARPLLGQMLSGASAHEADVTSGSASLSVAEAFLANSHGVRYHSRHTSVSVSLEAISGTSTGYEFEHGPFLSRVDAARVGEQATFLASRSAGGSEIATGEYDVILSPIAYADLLGNVLVPALSGRSVHQGRSRLAGKLGTAVAQERISMYDDPHISGGNGSTWYDAEGIPTRRVDYVKDGVLEAFAYDLKTAYRFGRQSTANAVRGGYGGLPSIGHHNFVVDGKRENIADERALYVHSVVGAHTANPMSGDFSVEISNAFWMENGGFCEPVRSAMLSGNVFDLHLQIAGLGKETRAIGTFIVPPVRINSQHIIGKH